MGKVVCVRTFERRVEAEMAMALLQNSGIDGQVLSDDMGGLIPAILASTGGSKLFVREEDSEKALEILAAIVQDEGNAADDDDDDDE